MKTIVPVCISILFCVFSLTCFGLPKDPVTGYYINQRGDSIHGSFPEKLSGNISVFKFQPGNSTAVMNISFDSCRMVSCGDDLYKNWYGKRSMAYIDKFSLDIVKIDDYETGKIPIKLIYKGATVNLYYFHDVKDHFFIEKGDSIQVLLIAYRYSTEAEKFQSVINPPNYFIIPIYRDQIIALMAGNLSRKQKLIVQTSNYDQLNMVRLFRKIDKAPKVKKVK